MKKILQTALVSAIMATSGFATVEVPNEGVFDTGTYSSGIDVNVTVQSGGTMNLTTDITLNEDKTITLESGANASITTGKTLTNEGSIVMNYTDEVDTGIFKAGDGDIKQNYGELQEYATVIANYDGNGATTWYVYEAAYKIDTYVANFYHKESGKESIEINDGWYGMVSCSTDIYPYTTGGWIDLDLAANNWGPLINFKQCLDSGVTSAVQINGVDSLVYNDGNVAELEDDTTDFSEKSLAGKTPKKIKESGAGFVPDITAKIATVKYTDTEETPVTHTLGSDMTSVTSKDTLDSYFSSFGVSFKQTDGSTATTTSYAESKPVIEAIAEAEATDAVLIDNTAIAVDSDTAVETNLHNIGVETPAPSFSGKNTLTLSGNNSLLTNATMNVPVKISGPNAIPTNATFADDLNIAESAEIASGSEVTVNGPLTVDPEKTLTISGKMKLGAFE